MEVLLAIFGPDSICRSLIMGASPLGAAMTVAGLEEDDTGSLGNVMLLWETGWKCSRRRPCIGAGVWAGEAGGSSENSCLLDLSDVGILGWVGSCGELKPSCLFGTEYPFLFSSSVFFEADWSLFLSLCCWDSIGAGFAMCSACAGGQCGAIWWGNGGRWSWSNFRLKTWAAGSLCIISLEEGNTGALWLVSVVARRPCEVGINLLLSLNWMSGDAAWTDSGCISWRKNKLYSVWCHCDLNIVYIKGEFVTT